MHANINTILIPNLNGIHVIDIASIIRIEAISSYSKLFLSDGKKIVVSKVLRVMQEMLEGKGFTRVHRSHLVNTAWIQTWQLNQMKVTLRNEEEISISRRKSPAIRKKLYERREDIISKQKMLLSA